MADNSLTKLLKHWGSLDKNAGETNTETSQMIKKYINLCQDEFKTEPRAAPMLNRRLKNIKLPEKNENEFVVSTGCGVCEKGIPMLQTFKQFYCIVMPSAMTAASYIPTFIAFAEVISNHVPSVHKKLLIHAVEKMPDRKPNTNYLTKADGPGTEDYLMGKLKNNISKTKRNYPLKEGVQKDLKVTSFIYPLVHETIWRDCEKLAKENMKQVFFRVINTETYCDIGYRPVQNGSWSYSYSFENDRNENSGYLLLPSFFEKNDSARNFDISDCCQILALIYPEHHFETLKIEFDIQFKAESDWLVYIIVNPKVEEKTQEQIGSHLQYKKLSVTVVMNKHLTAKRYIKSKATQDARPNDARPNGPPQPPQQQDPNDARPHGAPHPPQPPQQQHPQPLPQNKPQKSAWGVKPTPQTQQQPAHQQSQQPQRPQQQPAHQQPPRLQQQDQDPAPAPQGRQQPKLPFWPSQFNWVYTAAVTSIEC